MEERGIGARFIEPGSPWQNGHNESFNAVFRDGCLNRWLFESIRQARTAMLQTLQDAETLVRLFDSRPDFDAEMRCVAALRTSRFPMTLKCSTRKR
jgi:spore maturation protein CgeB